MEITERLYNIEKLLNEAKAKIDRALADCPPFLKTQHRPALAFYHANAKGTGCAVKMTLHPATVDASGFTTDGYIELTAANQMTVGNPTGPNPTFSRFDFDNAIVAHLTFDDVSRMLHVFRGECESVNDDNGIIHRNTKRLLRIRLRHIIDPVCGYSLELYAKTSGVDEERHTNFLMSTAEALGICEAFTASMGVLAFGE